MHSWNYLSLKKIIKDKSVSIYNLGNGKGHSIMQVINTAREVTNKDIKIKYNTSKEVSTSKKNDNYLKMIAEESKTYLEDQSKEKEN